MSEAPKQAAHADAGDLPTHAALDPAPPTLSPMPERVGPFHVVRELGQGGMGSVYLAEQREPLRRQVALKLIRAGLGGPRLQRRFEAEGQALARLGHPNVARVYQAGTSEEGRPWIAMESVIGRPIDLYCDANALPLRLRLELFRAACEGVQHAHQKAILHRDLKPSNILITEVDGQPVPKVIDFGLAKALDEPLTDTALSIDGGIIGTPSYLSPEAVDGSGADVDTRGDVYALGVVMFELIAGIRPYQAEDTRSLLRRILTVDVPQPSAALQGLPESSREKLARSRGLDPSAHRRALLGDLDWIVLKATARDRAARYGSAGELAEEISRWLRHEPLAASPPGRLYRLGKFVRRQWPIVLAASLIALVLLGGIVARSREAERANRETRAARQVSDFLVSLFRAATPGTRKASDISAKELLDAGAKRLQVELADQPEVRARLLDEIGNVCRSLGLYDQARPLLSDALRTRQALFAAGSAEVGESEGSLGLLELETGHLAAAEPLLREAVRVLETQGQERLAHSRLPVSLATVVGNLGRRDEAERLLKRTVDVRAAVFGLDAEPLAGPLNNLGNLYFDMKRYDEAAQAHTRALAIRERTLGAGHVLVAQSLNNLGNVRNEQGRYGEAEALQKRALEIKRETLAPDHQELGVSEHNLGDIAFKQSHLDAAEARYRAARAIFEKTLAPEHPYLAYSDQALANIARERGDAADAEILYRRALRSLMQSFGPGNAAVQELGRDYARLLRAQHRDAEAATLETGNATAVP